jgi:hypothetical protein
VRTLKLPDELFAKIEVYRRKKGISRAAALAELIGDASLVQQWWEAILERPRGSSPQTLDEADALAVEAVRATRRERRPQQ